MKNSGVWILGRVIYSKFTDGEETKFGKSILEMTLSVNTSQKKKEGEKYPPSYTVKVTLWDSLANSLSDKIESGVQVFIEGELGVPNSYENKDGDTVVQYTIINVSSIRVLGESSSNEQSSSSKKTQNKGTATQKKTAQATAKKTPQKKKPVVDLDDEDLDTESDDFDDVDALFDD